MATDEKLDLFKEHKDEYAAKRKPLILTPSKACYLTIEGKGSPEEHFPDAAGALYAIAYPIKMGRKKAGLGDYTICKLEGQYWGKTKSGDFSQLPKDEWNWKLLIRTPDFITEDDVREAAEAAKEKGKTEPVERVRLETIDEGPCVQQLHVGPYGELASTIASMQEHAASEGLAFSGLYHEIYLSDPRKTAPEKLRTLVRIPVA